MKKNTKIASILIVDDRPENLFALEATLEDIDANIVQASSGQQALEYLLNETFALVLLDVQMPEMDGYEVASMMKQSRSTKNTPIIFLTAISRDEDYIHQGYESGAVDYITKPINMDILISKVKIFIQMWQQKHELERLNKKYQEVVCQVKQQRDALKELAMKDYLTGLYQRRMFDEILVKEISQSVRHQSFLTVAMLDLDFFKKVNDTYGHAVGDDILISTASIFLKLTRTEDIVCRYGGEEFVIMMPNTELKEGLLTCERIRAKIEATVYSTNIGELHTTISIGVSQFQSQRESTPEQLLKHADDCLYKAKKAGRNQIFPQNKAS